MMKSPSDAGNLSRYTPTLQQVNICIIYLYNSIHSLLVKSGLHNLHGGVTCMSALLLSFNFSHSHHAHHEKERSRKDLLIPKEVTTPSKGKGDLSGEAHHSLFWQSLWKPNNVQVYQRYQKSSLEDDACACDWMQANMASAIQVCERELAASQQEGLICVTGSLHAVAAALKVVESWRRRGRPCCTISVCGTLQISPYSSEQTCIHMRVLSLFLEVKMFHSVKCSWCISRRWHILS